MQVYLTINAYPLSEGWVTIRESDAYEVLFFWNLLSECPVKILTLSPPTFICQTQVDPMHLKGSEKRRRKRKKKKQKRKRRKKRKKKKKRKRHGNEKTRSRPGSRSALTPSLAPLRPDGVKAQGDAGPSQAVRGERERGPGRQSTRQEQPRQSVRTGGLPQVPSLLLPLEVIDSRTLARLRYNPSIRVSIQVVGAEQQEDEVGPVEIPGEYGPEGGHAAPPRWPGEDANRITGASGAASGGVSLTCFRA